MSFGLRAQGMSDGSPEVLRDVSMATNFETQFAITGFLAFDGLLWLYDASDMLFDLRVGFCGQAI